MTYKKYFIATFLLMMAACTKFEDADVTERNTFVHFYSSATNYLGVVGEIDTDGGYILSGEIKNSTGITDALIIKTDDRGNKIWEKIIPNGVVNNIKPGQNGYILVGDSIKLNPGSEDVTELENTYSRLLLMDSQGNIVSQNITTGTVRRSINNEPVDLTIDYHGDAFTVDGSGDIIVLGRLRVPGESESTFISGFDPANLNDSLWYRSYVPLDNPDNFINCNSLHLNPAAKLVWATRTITPEQNVSREFLSVSQVPINSTVSVYTQFGQGDTRNHSVEDIQESAVEFGIVGTYAETNGLSGNIFFIRAEIDGVLQPGTARYIDGEDLMLNNTILTDADKTLSNSSDEGTAITATADGWVLACTMVTTPTVGNGGKDILLIKLDASGNLLWKRLIGGSGDEEVSSIRLTPDNGLLLCGTNTVNGLSTMMLMKTDSNGEIKK